MKTSFRVWLVHFLFGFSSGLPLLLTGSTLAVWMTEMKIDLKTIGAFALVGLPYNLKFLWSPLMDRYQIPFLGRRRGWLVLTQMALWLSIFLLGRTDPLGSIEGVAFLALMVSFVSASQDIVIDAYRRENLTTAEMGFGLSLYTAGYRIGMLIAGAISLAAVEQYQLQWSELYAYVSCFVALGLVATLLAPEASVGDESERPSSLWEATFGPFKDFFSQDRVFLVLLFILLYKLGDNLSSAMTAPFVIQAGYSKTEYGAMVKGVGLISSIVGNFVGAAFMARIGLRKSLWIFGIIQALAILPMVGLALSEKDNWVLGFAIGAEMFTAGMAVPAFNTYIAFLTNKKFTATQYALLTSLAAIPRTVISSPSGYLAEGLGWVNYFAFCALMAIPGLMMIRFLPKRAED